MTIQKQKQTREQKLSNFKTQKEEERKIIQNASELAARSRKEYMEKKTAFETKKKIQTKELLSSSLTVKSDRSKDLEIKEREKRRKSIALRNQMRAEADKREQLKLQEKQRYEEELIADKKLDYLQMKESMLAEAQKRRESLEARNEEMRKHQEFADLQKKLAKAAEREIIEVHRDLWKKNPDVQKKMKEKVRKSIAFRLENWRVHKKVELERANKELKDAQSNANIHKDEFEDVRAFRKEQAEKDREEIKRQNEEHRRQKEVIETLNAEKMEAKRYESELHEEERQDLLNYQLEMEKSRRESVVYRAETARRAAAWEQQQKQLEVEKKEADRILASTERFEMKCCKEQKQEENRQSLAFRNQKETEIRQKSAPTGGVSRSALKQINKQMRSADRQAILTAKQAERDRARESLAWALVQERKHKEIALVKHREALDRLHDVLEAKRNDVVALKEDKAEKARRSRESVAFRLDSWRKQRMVEEKLLAKNRAIEQENALYRALDVESVRAAKRENATQETVATILNFELLI